ncbi:Trimeric LpxA-like [Trinorchestia longiramus]|nr:Trimeric LpxA-like [Trinorchestia longiramus]
MQPGTGNRTSCTVQPATSIRTSCTVEPGTSIRTSCTVEPGTSIRTSCTVEPGTSIRTSCTVEPGTSIRTSCSLQPGTSNRTSCSLQPGTSNRTSCSLQPGTSNRTICSLQPGTSNHTSCSLQPGTSNRTSCTVSGSPHTCVCTDDERPTDGWADFHAPSCPRSNLPDLVSSQRTSRLTPESVRIHDPVLDDERPGARVGILKNGKLWKRSESHMKSIPKDRDDSHRRSVRFSGRDEYTTVDCSHGEDNGALSSNLSPKLQELSMILGKDPWQLDLGSSAHDHHRPLPGEQLPRPQDIDVCEMEDEHIAESVKRYEEMRRRIAADEGRRNTDETDEVDSPSDYQPIDPAAAESRIRRLENADIAHVAGGVLRSNSELRRAIEQNALRRSLIKFYDARKKDTNKNDKSDKLGSSILEKLKWLTATEDLTNGNSDDRSYGETLVGDKKEERLPGTLKPQDDENIEREKPQALGSVSQYRHLAEIFNQSTSVRSEPKLPSEVRERKHEQDVLPTGCSGVFEAKIDSSTYTAIPVVSFCEISSEDEADKLLYSGGVRYTREGTLMPPRRKELSVNKILGKVSRYSLNDIDEALHDDRSSSVPSSSQSSPRLSGRSDMDGTSTTESGYSSNETNGDHYSVAPLDELAEFVRQDASRLERLRLRYQEADDQDHGFGCRPAVKGIKPRYCVGPDHVQQQPMSGGSGRNSQQSNVYVSWQGRESPHENTSSLQRSRQPHSQVRSTHLPSLHEDLPYSNVKAQTDHRDCPQDACCHFDYSCHPESNEVISQVNVVQMSLEDADIEEQQRNSTHDRHCRTVDGYSLTNDHRTAVVNCPMSHEVIHQHDDRSVPSRNRLDFHNAAPPGHFGSTQSLQSATSRVHHPSCVARRPISLHDQMLRDAHSGMPPKPTDLPGRPHSSLGQYSGNHYIDEQIVDKSHQPLTNRGSFPGNPNSVSSPTQYSDSSLPHRHGGGYQPSLPGVVSGKYVHSPQELLSPNQGSPVGTGGISLMGCYPKPQQRASTNVSNRCYPSHWNPNSGGGVGGGPVAVPSHLSYTTPVVPPTGAASLPKQFSDVLSKVDVLHDERGVPEGASSSPRSSYDSQYSSQNSPPRDQNLLVRHSALPLDLSS